MLFLSSASCPSRTSSSKDLPLCCVHNNHLSITLCLTTKMTIKTHQKKKKKKKRGKRRRSKNNKCTMRGTNTVKHTKNDMWHKMCVPWEQENKNKMKQKTTIKTEGGGGGGEKKQQHWYFIKTSNNQYRKTLTSTIMSVKSQHGEGKVVKSTTTKQKRQMKW